MSGSPWKARSMGVLLVVGAAIVGACNEDSDTSDGDDAGAGDAGSPSGGTSSGGSTSTGGSGGNGGSGTGGASAGSPSGGGTTTGGTGGSGGASGGGSGGRACDERCETDGFDCCGSSCVNLSNDVRNCGSCGNVCEGEFPYCDGGTCAPAPCGPATDCGPGSNCCNDECCGEAELCCLVAGGGPVRPASCVRPTNGTCPLGCPMCE